MKPILAVVKSVNTALCGRREKVTVQEVGTSKEYKTSLRGYFCLLREGELVEGYVENHEFICNQIHRNRKGNVLWVHKRLEVSEWTQEVSPSSRKKILNTGSEKRMQKVF